MADVDFDPGDALIIRYRSVVARIHSDATYDGLVWRCGCGALLPCAAVTLLLADMAKDEDRITAEARP
jgi:hypothetical protein